MPEEEGIPSSSTDCNFPSPLSIFSTLTQRFLPRRAGRVASGLRGSVWARVPSGSAERGSQPQMEERSVGPVPGLGRCLGPSRRTSGAKSRLRRESGFAWQAYQRDRGTSEVPGSLVLPWDRLLGSGLSLELRFQRVGGERPPPDLPPFPPFPIKWGACGLVLAGNAVIFLTIQGFFLVFGRGDDFSWEQW
ncbi:hypothetical protein J1605_020764 [Eschrichtius robustus]|uniref:Uncharacterized protein n=1 Tax=Eschrichtius robustus TaxID=9764 RepID=A0AB34HEE5_ESCRO|nr:hypothetical protein J1605_020764 [Eschrichtius robustus]